MSALSDLYQEVVLEHSAHPRNFGSLDHPTRREAGYNPLCGDKLKLDLTIEQGRVTDVRFAGEGCAISRASASLMTEAVKGKTVAEAKALFSRMHLMFTLGDAACPFEDLGKLCALSGVWEYPSRVKCASLAWNTLRAALEKESTKEAAQ